nr:FAD-binding protein [Actinomycetota bacterium]
GPGDAEAPGGGGQPAAAPDAPRFSVRRRWRNHTGNQSVDPLRLYDARSLGDLVAIVQEAERHGATVRAVGSGHSWSDVTLTPGFLVKTHRLDAVLPLEDDLLRPGLDGGHLVRAQGGIRLRALNRELDRRGLGLSNMGGYDAQTLAGVMATSTHGSGLEFGPIADAVRSLDLVASGGRVIRVEPEEGITDPAAYRARRPDHELVQDDRWFDAVRVGMGCMGLVYAATVAVEDEYWLREVRTPRTWSQVREDLRAGDVLRAHRHYEVYLNPHARDGDNRCLVTTRDRADPRGRRRPGGRRRNSLPEFLALLPVTPHVLNLLLDLRPEWTPRMLDMALRGLADEEFTSVSYEVLNIGAANLVPAYSAEIGVPVDGRGCHVEAVERIIAIADRYRATGRVYSTSPISLRFVRASSAYLSMMHDRTTMMIELIQMTRTEGGFELLAAYEEALYDLGGRPHWGQVNTLTGSHELVRSMYPRFDDWLAIHRLVNDSGVFDSPFAKRVGISASSYDPCGEPAAGAGGGG